ncbi:MAG TPA: AIM24 family protein [Mycobacterium sp.]|nr:AIM24 family protein [Mycobacterium sp.]
MDAKIIGNVMPVREVTLNRGETLIAESGELSWMTESIQLRTSTRMAGATGIFGTLKRMAAGGGLFMTDFWAHDRPGRIAFAAKLPPLAGGWLQRLADSGHDTGLPAPLFDQCRLLSAGSSRGMGNPRLGGFGPRRRAQ